MDWRVKGMIQKVLGFVPGGEWINDTLQKSIGDLSRFESHTDAKVKNDWGPLVSHMMESGLPPQNLEYVEVGSGWYPTLPFCYALAGAKLCRTYDINRHLSEELTFRVLRSLERHLPLIASASGLPLDQVEAIYRALRACSTLPQLLKTAKIEYVAPGDASDTGLPAQSADVVYSNSVLEHILADVILAILRETKRILKPGGLTVHSVACNDHYAHFDRNITFINYLQYSQREWGMWNTKFLYQNRLRPQDFLRLVQEAGLRVTLTKQKPRPDLLEKLPAMKIAPEFSHYSNEELCSTFIDFVARPA
jgi:SAM-dependent methyltransferase